MTKQEKIKELLNILSKQAFYDFYNKGIFDDWIQGVEPERQETVDAEVRKQLEKMFSKLLN